MRQYCDDKCSPKLSMKQENLLPRSSKCSVKILGNKSNVGFERCNTSQVRVQDDEHSKQSLTTKTPENVQI